ncbi:hypothetical protein BDR05DRAFT_801063 [Suillus weaverae]|nr:hypothetical protein BDR05DRAFT_801063 [Suillus weaverae]
MQPQCTALPRTHSSVVYTEATIQNRLDEPFILDVNLDNFSLDDFTFNIQDSPIYLSSTSTGVKMSDAWRPLDKRDILVR